MKILKIILLVILLSIPIVSFGTGTITSGDKAIDLADFSTLETQIDDSQWIPFPVFEDAKHRDMMNWDPDYEYWTTFESAPEDWIVIEKSKLEPDTLLGWFKDLTLDEKVVIYNQWRDKDKGITWDWTALEIIESW